MNASSSVIYAVKVWLDADAQRAEWAARQVWEAADLTSEDEDGEATFGPPEEASDVNVAAAAFVDESLDAVSADDLRPEDLRTWARAAAGRWWRPVS